MKTLDLTQLGGFPLTQDALKWMQDNGLQTIAALAGIAGSTPVLLSGCLPNYHEYPFGAAEIAAAGGFAPQLWPTWTNGYILYNGEIIPFAAGDAQETIVINAYSTTLDYDNGGTHAAMQRKEASFGTGGTQLNLSDLLPFGRVLAAQTRSAWVTLADTTNVKLYYRVDRIANTVSLRGTFTRTNSELATGLLTTLGYAIPAPLKPSADVWFRATINTHGIIVKDDEGSVYPGMAFQISAATGDINYQNTKMAAGTAALTEYINITYPID